MVYSVGAFCLWGKLGCLMKVTFYSIEEGWSEAHNKLLYWPTNHLHQHHVQARLVWCGLTMYAQVDT